VNRPCEPNRDGSARYSEAKHDVSARPGGDNPLITRRTVAARDSETFGREAPPGRTVAAQRRVSAPASLRRRRPATVRKSLRELAVNAKRGGVGSSAFPVNLRANRFRTGWPH